MNRSKTIYTSTLLFSIAFFILGQILFVKLFEFFEPKVDGVLFQIIERGGILKTSLLFSLILALIPALILLTWRLARIISLNKKIASVLIILIFVVTAIFMKHQEVKTYFIRVVKPILSPNDKMNVTYPIDPVNFVYYIFSGLCIGCIVSYFLFWVKKIKLN